MTGWLVWGPIGVPLLTAMLVAVMLRRASARTVHRLTVAMTGLTALGTLVLLPHAGSDRVVTVEWLPGTGPMALGLSPTGIYAALMTTSSAFLALLASNRDEDRSVRRLSLSKVVMLLALAAANVAFLAEHFLARYVALEIVALCIALTPLVEIEEEGNGFHAAWSSYLLLRVGDAGLLVAILMLMDASGTLQIGPALDYATSGAVGIERLGWIVAGLVLAVWAKMGGWPFHLWILSGQRLTLGSRAWLFATLMPNLGLYLLYRVTPLVALPGLLRTTAMWLGAGGALLAGFLALVRRDARTSLVYLGAAQAGLALFTAAGGFKAAIWLVLLATTPLRVLLHVAADAPRLRATASPLDKLKAGILGLGGLALAGIGSMLVAWMAAGEPPAALFVARTAVALLAAWSVHATLLFLSEPGEASRCGLACWTRRAVLVLLGAVVLTGGLAFRPLARRLALAADLPPPAISALPTLLHQVVTIPVLLAAAVLVATAWFIRQRFGHPSGNRAAASTYAPEGGLARAAQALRSSVEAGILEQAIGLAVRAVTGTAHVVHRFVEHECLERLLRQCGDAVLKMARTLQRWHSGRLRRNLLWVPISLVLALLILMLCGP